MCGIAGCLNASAAPVREAAVARICEAMRHRGPDDFGLLSWGGATLGMRRLAIFDPANGRQPMSTADGRWHLVFNGAIYNHRELRATLETHGHAFRTRCDTEVLLAALAHWGEDALPRLRGMFAFALWDAREHTLLLARDPLGIKPLYYHHAPDALLFASELQALRTAPPDIAPGLSGDIDAEAVAAFLASLAVPAPLTLHRGIRCLRPGECLRWRDGRLAARLYWNLNDNNAIDPPPAGAPAARTPEEFQTGLRSQLENTLRAHALADVPVGAFLSGGLDSTLVAALMIRHGAGGATGGRLRTFSIGFDEPGWSEAAEAAASARHLGADHHAVTLTGARVASDIDNILAALDQPSGDGINTYYASQAARAGGVTVALSGLGADELFGGYPSFRRAPRLLRLARAFAVLPRPLREMLLRAADQGGTGARKLADTLRHGRSIASVALLQRRVLSDSEIARLLPGVPYEDPPALSRLETETRHATPLSATSAAELRGYMADVLLRDSDAMSMRHSLELRVPFVDLPLLTWLQRQPDHLRFDPRRVKGALIDATRDLLPPGLADRPKRGFSLPFPLWMKRELRPFLEDTFAPGALARQHHIDPAAARALWTGFLAGRDDRAWSRVWSLAVLLTFLRRAAP